MYFTDSDIADLKQAYIGVNVESELKKMQLQAKQIGKVFTVDRTRRRIYSWLQNVQNNLGANTQISTKIYHIDPNDAKPKHKKTPEEQLAELPPHLREAYERGMAELREAERKSKLEREAQKNQPIPDRFKKFITRTAYSLDELQHRKEAQNDR